MTLATNLKEIRKSRKLTQKQLATKAGVSQTTISDIERERNQSSLELPAIAKALKVSVEDLLHGNSYQITAPRPDMVVMEAPAEPYQPADAEDFSLFARMLALQAGLLALIRTAPLSPNLPAVLAEELSRARDVMAANPIDDAALSAFDDQAESIRLTADIHHSRRS